MLRLVLLGLVLGASVAHADGTPPADGTTLKFNRFLIHADNSTELTEPNADTEEVWKYFNLAHCVCSQFQKAMPVDTFHEDSFEYEVTVENPTGTTTVNHPAEVWVGAGCNTDDTTVRNADCTKIDTTKNLTDIDAAGSTNIKIPIYEFMTPKQSDRSTGGCLPRRLTGSTYLNVDADPVDGKFEYWETKSIDTDAEAPPLPTNFRAVGAEEAIEISWDPPSDVSDVAYYQALCAAGPNSDQVAIKGTPPAPRYQTPYLLCGATQSLTLMPSDIASNDGVDASTTAIPLGELATQNPAYICGESDSATSNSLRIKGLTNGTPYLVALLAIDKYGNAAGTYFTSRLTPIPATDFWEDIHNQGSRTEGGFCLISQTFGDDSGITNTLRSFRDNTLASTAFGRWLTDVYYALSFNMHGNMVARIAMAIVLLPFILVALLWHVLSLPVLLALIALLVLVRRRSTRLRLQLATAGVFLLLPVHAHAQTPYWEDDTISDTQEDLPIGDPERVKWHAGVRVGPYVPGIDAQIDKPTGKYDGPYEQMFGGYSILPVIDIERFFYRGFGQAGLGVSVGYMGKKAHAWEAGSDPNDAMRPRAEGDNNTFRLFPVTLSAVYRFTYLDDEYGIPLVPYARAGLGYYVWWIVAPNGDFASSCTTGGDTMGCDKTTAAGASLGFVGSIGLAIRAERIDVSAARSMRESGIEHAGFYGEYSVGKVDGFGSDKKLSVGDATWFAGVDFEF
jgi:hypothetical protein